MTAKSKPTINSPTILALDAAGSACSAALLCGGEIRSRRFEAMVRGQSERLVPMIDDVMAEAGLAYEELDAIAVTRGPGGFTGVRIGLATGRALALACACPLIGVSNFETVAAAVPEAERQDRTLVILLDAKRQDIYAQAFTAQACNGGLSPLTEPRSITPAALDDFLPPGRLLLVGDGVEQAQAALSASGRDILVSAAPGTADAAVVARLAADRSWPVHESGSPAPLYLRPPDVTLPKTRPKTRPKARAKTGHEGS